MPEVVRKILLIQPTAIGDTLISSGAVQAIGERFAGSELIIAHGPNNKPAVNLLAAPVTPVSIAFTNPATATREMRALAPDIVIDLTPWPYATALCARLSGVWSAGFAPAINRRGQLFDLAVEHRTDRHEIGNLRALAHALGADSDCAMAIRRAAVDLPDDLAVERLVLVHASAGGARALAKGWPVGHWAELVQGLVADGWQVGFTGVAADLATVEPILAAAGLPASQAFSLCGRLSLAQLAQLLGDTPLLISVDTGVLHLSAAVEGRSIGLHGPTFARRWGSLSSRARGLDAPHAAAGFIHYGWEEHPEAAAIMPSLAPAVVLAEARQMLAEALPGESAA